MSPHDFDAPQNARTLPAATERYLGASPPPTPFVADKTLPQVPGYELLGELGRGGMGVVFKARQISANRLVALKTILAGQLASDADVQRFRAEAEAAAHLDHPHIVPIYEVATHGELHFFSMKLIEEGTLTSWINTHCRRDKASTPPSLRDVQAQAVELMAKVARAVHHAHQRGILHRDLKPGNVLLDGSCQPYVTDFGLAKRVEGDSGLTRTGAIMGTPAYMAPEQARGTRGLSTAADVYALGAILYELLTGRPPFQGPSPLDTVMQVLDQEPMPPRRLNPGIDRDLEIICLKCLEKDPAKRYGSAESLAEELECWLRGDPIVARPVGRLERSWRWYRRNAVVASLTAALIAVLAFGLITLTILYVREQALRDLAQREQQNSFQHLTNVLMEKKRTAESYQLARATLEEVLKIRDDPRLQAGQLEDLKKHFASAERAFYEKFLQLRGDDPEFQAERAKALAAYSSLLYHQGNMDDALKQISEALAINEALRGSRLDNTEALKRLADNQTQLGIVVTKLGRMDDAIRAKQRACELNEELLAHDPGNVSRIDRTAMSLQNLGVAYRGAGRLIEAEASLQKALAVLARVTPSAPNEARMIMASQAIILSNLAEFYPHLNRPQDAVAAFGKAVKLFEELADKEPDEESHRMNIAGNLNNFGLLLERRGQIDEAAEAWRKAIASYDLLVAKRPTENQYRHALAMTHDNFGMLELRRRRISEAREHFDGALQLWARLLDENPNVVEYISDLGCVQRNLGDLDRATNNPDRALLWYAKAIATLETSPDRDRSGTNSHSWLIDAVCGRADALTTTGRLSDALKEWDRAVELQGGMDNAPPSVKYQLARVYALLASNPTDTKADAAQRALDLLRQAASAGYFKLPPHLARFKSDDAFKSLQKDPEFIAFAKTVEMPS